MMKTKETGRMDDSFYSLVLGAGLYVRDSRIVKA